jgi:AraC-like DNA-binding protein
MQELLQRLFDPPPSERRRMNLPRIEFRGEVGRDTANLTNPVGKPGEPTKGQMLASAVMTALGAVGPGRAQVHGFPPRVVNFNRNNYQTPGYTRYNSQVPLTEENRFLASLPHRTHAGPYSAPQNVPQSGFGSLNPRTDFRTGSRNDQLMESGRSRNPWVVRNLPQHVVDEIAAARRGSPETPAATYRQLGERYGLDPSTIYNILRNRASSSVTPPPAHIPPGRSGPRPTDDATISRIREMAQTGATQADIAAELGVSRPSVTRMMATHGITRTVKPLPYDLIVERLNRGYPVQQIANELGMSRTHLNRIISEHGVRPTVSGEERSQGRSELRAAGTIPTPGVRPGERHGGMFGGSRRTKNDNFNPLTNRNEYVKPGYSWEEGYVFRPPTLLQANTMPDPLTLQSWGLVPGVRSPNLPRWTTTETGERAVSTPPGYRPVDFDPTFESIAQSNERNRAMFNGRPEAQTMIPANRRTYMNEEGQTVNESLNLAIMRQLGILPKDTP